MPYTTFRDMYVSTVTSDVTSSVHWVGDATTITFIVPSASTTTIQYNPYEGRQTALVEGNWLTLYDSVATSAATIMNIGPIAGWLRCLSTATDAKLATRELY